MFFSILLGHGILCRKLCDVHFLMSCGCVHLKVQWPTFVLISRRFAEGSTATPRKNRLEPRLGCLPSSAWGGCCMQVMHQMVWGAGGPGCWRLPRLFSRTEHLSGKKWWREEFYVVLFVSQDKNSGPIDEEKWDGYVLAMVQHCCWCRWAVLRSLEQLSMNPKALRSNPTLHNSSNITEDWQQRVIATSWEGWLCGSWDSICFPMLPHHSIWIRTRSFPFVGMIYCAATWNFFTFWTLYVSLKYYSLWRQYCSIQALCIDVFTSLNVLLAWIFCL